MNNIKPYSKYKSSGIAWLGEIPEHWEQTQLNKLFFDNKNENENLVENNLLTLSYGKIKRKDISSANGLLPASFSNYQIIDKGDIILRLLDLQNDKNSLRVGYVNERGIITSAYIGLKIKNKNCSKYFFTLLNHLDLIKHFYNGGGGVRQSMGYSELAKERLCLPSLPEQTAIATFLDYKLSKIDRFIRKKKQLIKLLNEQKAGIINQAVTKGLNPNAKMKPSSIEWLGDIPEHWEVRKLKYAVTLNDETLSEKTDPDYQLRYIDIGNVDESGKVAEIVNYKFKDAPSRAKRIVKDGDVIISTVRTYLKAITQIPSNCENLIVSTGFAVLSPRNEINSDFLNSSVRANYFIQRVCSESFGVSYPAINASDLVNFEIAFPNIPEQTAIVSHIEIETAKLNQTISTIEKEISLVEEYKTALIAEAVTGKIDVRGYEIPEIEETESYDEIEEELSMVAEDEEDYQTIEE